MGIDAEILVRNVRRETVTDEWLKVTSWNLCRSIGADKFFINAEEGRMAIERTLSRYRDDSYPPPGSEYHQDGEPIIANAGECLLDVHVWTRYYGEGYERGDILTLCAIAEWLEFNVEGCEVWYGGDSSGVLVAPFHAARRLQLRRHLYSDNGRKYFSGFWRSCADEYGKPPACKLCPNNTYGGSRYGAGQGYASFHCSGCGKSCATRNHGKTWTEETERI